MECLASVEHTNQMQRINRDTVRILKNEEKIIPLKNIQLIFAMKIIRKVEVEDEKLPVLPVVNKLSELLSVPVRFIGNTEPEYLARLIADGSNKNIIIFTENAHLDKGMSHLVTRLSEVSRSMVLCALRNPYDQDLKGVKNAVCSYGYSVLQQDRLIEILSGEVNE